MERLDQYTITIIFLSLGLMLCTSRVLAEAANRLNQPAVIGEILAGIVLGPSILGSLAPQWFGFLSVPPRECALVIDGLVTLSVVLFLLVAGLEVDLSIVWRQGRKTMGLAISGIVVPFLVGFVTAWFFPWLLRWKQETDLIVFALFFATALSITALPVIVKIMMDMNLYRSEFGMTVVAAAVFNDLIGWSIFSIILGLMSGSGNNGNAIVGTIALFLLFSVVILTVGRWMVHRVLPWIQAYTAWPGGVLCFALSLALLGAAFAEWIGIHAIFGSFLIGIALGESSHLREQTRMVLHQFISFFFAPIFFASIGLKVDFFAHFDVGLMLVVLAIACLGKVGGCTLGARLAGIPRREAWAFGFAMNARGAMEIILSLLALQYGLIGHRLFVALVIMALVTSISSGPLIQTILNRKKKVRFFDYLGSKTFTGGLSARERGEAIAELSRLVSSALGLTAEQVLGAVMSRERIMATGLGNGVAIPHARIDGLKNPVVAIGLSRYGIDFDAPDGHPAHVIVMILSPTHDNGIQLEILADIAKTFRNVQLVSKLMAINSYTEFLALVRVEGAGAG